MARRAEMPSSGSGPGGAAASRSGAGLASIQADFARALRDPAGEAGAAWARMRRHLAPGPGPRNTENNEQVALNARFNVHRNNVYSSLIDALAALYPVCRRLVGAAFFRAAARAYLARSLPEQATLIGFARDFPGFLVGFEPARALAYLPDVARLEHAWHRVYHGPDARPLGPQDLAGTDDAALARCVLALVPAHALLMSPHPISRIWEANQPGRDGKLILEGGAGARPGDGAPGERVLVVRPRAQVEVRRLSAGAFAFLCAVDEGRALGRAMLATHEAEPSRDPAGIFADLLRSGCFTWPSALSGPSRQLRARSDGTPPGVGPIPEGPSGEGPNAKGPAPEGPSVEGESR